VMGMLSVGWLMVVNVLEDFGWYVVDNFLL